jgi:hypothetical protein
MNWQLLLVLALVSGSVGYLLTSAYRSFRLGQCGGCAECGAAKPLAGAFGGTNLVQLGRRKR